MPPNPFCQPWPVKALLAGIHVHQSSRLPSHFISLSIVNGLWDPHYYSICERLKDTCRMSKEDSEVSGMRRSESQDSRETILALLDKDDVVRRLVSLALVLDDQGHPRHAERAYEEVIETRRKVSRQDDQVLLFCRGKISSILRQRGCYKEAEDQCRHVLELSIGSTGPSSSLSLQTAGDLALVLRDQGKFDNAFNQIHDILDNETCSPYQDALHVRLVTILAIILRDCGHYDMSWFLTRNALRVSDALFGNEDPFTLDLASELSHILTEKSIHRLAEEFARRALDGFAKTFGTEHPQSLKAASRLANAMRFDGRLGDATELFERTLKAQELQLGSTNPDTVPTKCGLAATYALDARYRDSVSILRQTLDQQNTVFGGNSHPDTEWTKQALQKIRAFQRALSTDSTSESDMEEESRRMRDFFKRPFRKDQRNLQLCDDITLSQKNTGEVRSQSDSQVLAAASDVSTDLKNILPSSSDKASVSGICGTILHAACWKGNIESVQMLLDSGKDVNVKGGIFETPLRAASYGGHIEIVKLLLKHDANVEDHGKHGFSALQLALSMGYNDLARTLLDAGANPEVDDHWYGTVLHEASMDGQKSMVDLLLEAKAKPNAETGIFGTALGAAAWKGSLTIVQSLIKKGAIVNIQIEERTALDLAASGGHQGIMEALIGAADNGNETLIAKKKSENFEQKSLDPDKPLENDLKPKEQSEPLEQKPVKGLKPKEQSEPLEQKPVEGLKPKEQSEPLEQKPVEGLKPKEQSEPLERKPPKPPRPSKPKNQGSTNNPSPNRCINSMQYGMEVRGKAGKTQAGKTQAGKTQAGKTQAGTKKAKIISLAKGVTSATKSRIPSSDAWSARFRRKSTSSHLMA